MDKVFNNGPSKICGRQSLKNSSSPIALQFVKFLPKRLIRDFVEMFEKLQHVMVFLLSIKNLMVESETSFCTKKFLFFSFCVCSHFTLNICHKIKL